MKNARENIIKVRILLILETFLAGNISSLDWVEWPNPGFDTYLVSWTAKVKIN